MSNNPTLDDVILGIVNDTDERDPFHLSFPLVSTQPPTKPAAPQSAEPSAKPATFVPDQQWVGRYVYSSDDKELGKIRSVKTSGTSSQVFFDMGGFLGLGATRKSVTSNQILDVNKDRIVLRLTEAEAQKLPAAEK